MLAVDNIKAAVRSLLSTPVPTLVVIATLAIAIGANTAIFSVVNGVLLRPIGYGDEGRLAVLWAENSSAAAKPFRLSPADYRDVRDGVTAFDEQVALSRRIGSTLTALDRPVNIGSLGVTPRLFSVLAARPAVGQFFVDEDERPGGRKKLVMTHASWTRRFGADPSIVGSSIELDSEPYTVVGVTEPGFRFPPGDDEIEVYFPMAISDAVLLDRDHRMFDAVARLADNVTLASAQAELDALGAQLAIQFPDTNEGWGITARPLRQQVLGDLATTLWILSGAVLMVLMIACANIANVLVARSTASSREFAVRAALGASRQELYGRSLAESLVIGLAGGAAGVLLALWGGALLRAVMPPALARGAAVGMDTTVLLFAAVLSIGATALFGSLPALRSTAPNLLELLKPAGASGTAGGGGRRVRELMVVAEVALAIVLLVGAGLMVRSFSRMRAVDPGFRQQDVVSVAVQLPSSRYGRAERRLFFEQLVGRVQQVPGVNVAGAVSDLPMSDVALGLEFEFSVVGLDALLPSARPNADFRLVVPGYFDAMGMQVVAGRAFDSRDAVSDRIVVMINETIVERYFRDIDPIGRSVQLDMLGELEIVGVVSDIRHGGLQAEYESEIFLPYGRLVTAEMHVVVHSELGTAAVAAAVGDVLRDMDPEIAPSSVVAISDLLWESIAQPRFNTALLGGLALCAALLAVLGTYGIVAYSVSERTGEIGVRMALGADGAATVAMIVRHALGIVLVGALLGIVVALGASRFLDQLLFGVPPTDPLTYGVVLVAAVLLGLLAAWIPARRATSIDPVAALREQ